MARILVLLVAQRNPFRIVSKDRENPIFDYVAVNSARTSVV